MPRVDAMMRAGAGQATCPSSSNGPASTPSPAGAWTRFRHGRVLFAGDSAHGVSPFGARGANSGVQDAENLAWKLALVLRGRAGDALLDSYAAERESAADENILNSTRATDFITPKSEISRAVPRRRAAPGARACRSRAAGQQRPPVGAGHAARLAAEHAGRRRASQAAWCPARRAPTRRCGRDGRALAAARTRRRLHRAGRGRDRAQRSCVARAAAASWCRSSCSSSDCRRRRQALADVHGLVAERYDLQPGAAVLLRPDQHVCARWRQPDARAVRAALARALALA